MVSIKSLLSLTLFGVAAVNASPVDVEDRDSSLPGCGEVNVFYTGLPPYHPFVIEEGWDPVMVDAALKADTNATVAAGYNVQIVWAGPETPRETVGQFLCGTDWDVTGVGFGVRGSTIADVITMFEDTLTLFRNKTPKDAPVVFNRGPDSLLWSIQRRFPLSSDCAGKPGKLIGYEEICDERCDH